MTASSGLAPSAERLTELLREGGSLPVGRVVEVAVEPIGTFSAALARLRVRYRDAAGDPPERMILKAAVPGRRDRSGESLGTELRFYRELAGGLPLRTPRLYGGSSEPAPHGALLLEELRGLEAADWLRGPGESHARAALAALAGVHAAWWCRVEALDWVPSFADEERLADFERAYARSWSRVRGRFEQWVPGFGRLGDALQGRVAACHRLLADEPTLLHGDAHAENLPRWRPSEGGDGVAALDWAGPRRGHAGVDVGFFIVMSLPPARRRRLERSLVAHHDAVLRGLEVQPRVDPWLAYRRGVLRRVSRLVAIACDWDPAAVASLRMLAERCGSAAVDLDLQELVT